MTTSRLVTVVRWGRDAWKACAGSRSGFWFIPTCVGLGSRVSKHSAPSAVHPHVRGARSVPPSPTTSDPGPSPRAWSLVQAHTGLDVADRSIPTCVGLGAADGQNCLARTVHPHVRGARSRADWRKCRETGPSPRAWGLGVHAREHGRSARSIPTCVGLGSSGRTPLMVLTVHPHVRGAWEPGQGPGRFWGGPSPRAWGLVCRVEPRPGDERPIPTCVGLGLPDLHKLSPLPICNQTHRGNPHARGNAITIRSEPHGESHPLRHLRTGTIGNTIYRSRTHKCPLKTNGCPTTSTPLEPDRNHHQTPRNRQLLSWNIPGVKSTIRKNSTSDRLTGVSHKNWTASPASSSKRPHRTPKPLTPRPTRGNNPRAHSTDQSDINPEIHTTPQTLSPGIPVVVFPKKSCPYSPVML